MGRAILSAVLSAILIATSALADTTRVPPDSVTAPGFLNEMKSPLLETARRTPAGAKTLEAVERALVLARREEVYKGRFAYAIPARDLSRSGGRDVLGVEYAYTLTYDSGYLGSTFKLDSVITVKAFEGRSGDLLWKRTDRVENGVAYPVDARVGKGAGNGIIWMRIDGLYGPVQDTRLTLTALAGPTGRKLWRHRYEGKIVEGGDAAQTYAGVPVAVDTFDALPGQHTDVLIGTGNIVAVYYQVIAADVGTAVIDGQNGSETTHPQREQALRWVPAPWATGDLDGDGLDDYVFSNLNGAAVGEEPTDPDPITGDVLKGRRGRDGGELWITVGFTYGDVAWMYPTKDTSGDRVADLLVMTNNDEPLITGTGRSWDLYLVSGRTGAIQWQKLGGWPYSPGDIDGDGYSDIVARDAFLDRNDDYAAMRFFGYSATGKRLYNRVIKTPLGLTGKSLGYGVGWGFWQIGDLQPDGLVDSYVGISASNDVSETYDHYAVDARSAKVLHRGGKELLPLGDELDARGTDLATIEVDGQRVIISARRGSNATQLWRSTITSDLPFRIKDHFVWAESADLTGDKCGEVLVAISAEGGSYLIVLDGGNGRLMWFRTLYGHKLKAGAAAEADRNPAC
jgi:hypothetical protein